MSYFLNGLDGRRYDVKIDTPLASLADRIINTSNSLVFKSAETTATFHVNGKIVEINVPTHFEWDGASIPFIAQWAIGHPLSPRFRLASMLHDAAYEDRSQRVINDCIFYAVLRSSGVSAWKSAVMFIAVRVGGHVHYASKTSKPWRAVRWLLNRM